MAYATILAAACGGDDDDNAVNLSASLAQRQSALVRVLMAFPDPALALADWGGMAGIYLAPEVLDQLEATQSELKAKVRACAEAAAKREGLALGPGKGGCRMVLEKRELLPWQALGLELPLADLVVMGAMPTQGAGLSSGPFADALMSGRAPVLIARGPELPMGSPVAIAWDGSLEAGRAVRAALPLLKEASKVVILQDPGELTDDEKDAAAPQRLIEYLQLSGITAVEAKTVPHGREGAPLVAAATGAGARLLAAGAYGHSRLREWVLGGATRALLDGAPGLHLLIAH